MGTWLIRLGLVWVIASFAAVAVLTAFAYRGGQGRPTTSTPRPHPVDPTVVRIDLRDGADDADATREAAFGSRRVTVDSGALERLMAGVALPCDLQPVAGDDDPTERLSFFTCGHDAREVAVKVVDELERLGMRVEPLSYTEARAFRDGAEIAVTVHLEPRRFIRDRRVVYAGLPDGSVVIEFSAV